MDNYVYIISMQLLISIVKKEAVSSLRIRTTQLEYKIMKQFFSINPQINILLVLTYINIST